MEQTQKGKIINNVSATTAIDLKAELAQQLEHFEKVRSSTGKQTAAQKPDKKPTVWSRQNKGVNARNEKDARHQLEAVEGHTLTKSREQLEKKAKIYEALRSGKYRNDDYDENDDKGPLIDFDRKYIQERELDRAKEEAEKKRKRRRQNEEEEDDDPWVEYVDEFGRTRVVRRSEVPERSPSPDPYSDEDDGGYSMDRPGYELDDGLGDRSNMNHYEADREIRTKGVGFYGFSKDEQEREEQLAKLNQLRAETENARNSTSSASERRKQMLAKNAEKIRARKAALQAKKHQLKPDQIPQNVNAPVVNEDSISNFLESVHKQMK